MNGHSNSNDHDETLSLSFWLLPKDPARTKLAETIATFSQHKAASVPFEPHVTVVGSIPCSSEKTFRRELLPRLQKGLQKSPQLTCQFSPTPIYKETWNQACVLVMDLSPEFVDLVQLCRDIASTKNEPYPPPLRKPHLSLYYGTEGAPSPDDIAERLGNEAYRYSFEASQLAIWNTKPSSANGVAEWKELAVIDLLPERLQSTLPASL